MFINSEIFLPKYVYFTAYTTASGLPHSEIPGVS